MVQQKDATWPSGVDHPARARFSRGGPPWPEKSTSPPALLVLRTAGHGRRRRHHHGRRRRRRRRCHAACVSTRPSTLRVLGMQLHRTCVLHGGTWIAIDRASLLDGCKMSSRRGPTVRDALIRALWWLQLVRIPDDDGRLSVC